MGGGGRVDRRARRRLAGAAFLVVLVLLAWLSVALYKKKFSHGRDGHRLHQQRRQRDAPRRPGHGARRAGRRGPAGQRERRAAPGWSSRSSRMPSQNCPPTSPPRCSPRRCSAQRYVDLILPGRTRSRRPWPPAVSSRQNRSADAIELEHVLNNLLPMLNAIQPDKLSLTLTAIADGLQGRGTSASADPGHAERLPQGPEPRSSPVRHRHQAAGRLSQAYSAGLPLTSAALNDFSSQAADLPAASANYAALLANITIASDDLHSLPERELAATSSALLADSLPRWRSSRSTRPSSRARSRTWRTSCPRLTRSSAPARASPACTCSVLVVPRSAPTRRTGTPRSTTMTSARTATWSRSRASTSTTRAERRARSEPPPGRPADQVGRLRRHHGHDHRGTRRQHRLSGTPGTTGYHAVFSDVTGVRVGNDVDIAGVRVGQVTSISVYHRDLAVVGFTLQPGRQLPRRHRPRSST